MENLEIYNEFRSAPQEALTPITAGKLKGRSDINPMWRIKELTRAFGAVGFGWKYEILKQWLEPSTDGATVSAFCNINLYVRIDDIWSEAIPGTGGSNFAAMVGKDADRRIDTNDDCYKMALTDAISVACKALGMAADVYWQNDRTKYTLQAEQAKKNQQTSAPAAQQPAQAPQQPVSDDEGIRTLLYIVDLKACETYDMLQEVYSRCSSQVKKPENIQALKDVANEMYLTKFPGQ